ncbi:chromate efflux transporter [Roseivivax sp. THAF30]|uniref:chromate efflux transporter n=1 Tax=Roseivivax sp. THAF30 TaxID=2587852 RepID=UPI001268F2F1|nr:chromate efflux transporter [Roseivivax sp. THAF30]QFT63716.1 putative chromate transport protein [Roseivivax sp. THAF30]
MSSPSLSRIARIFHRIGWLSFGGPAAQIALMHRTIVDEERWLDEPRYLRALSFCMLLPGPEAMQVATYAGWSQRGILGGLIAGGLFVLPGALVIAALALAYSALGTAPLAEALLLGVQATVIVIVLQALWRLSSRSLKGPARLVLALAAFIAIYALDLPYPAILAVAAGIGALAFREDAPGEAAPALPSLPLRTITLWTALWLAPLAFLWIADAPFLTSVGAFFAKLAVVSFGGAYAALAYMAQDAAWVDAETMIDALGLAETTPGPLVLATQFVAMSAGHEAGGAVLSVLAGLLTLWMMFLPSFLFIFAFAAHIDWLSGRPGLSGALSGVTAAVVGVILNLSVFFALNVLFAETRRLSGGPFDVEVPVFASLSPLALGLTLFAGGLILLLNRNIVTTLALTAALSAAISLL